MTSPPDPLSSLLDLVRAAAREGVEQAIAAQETVAPTISGSLVDKRGLAHVLGVSPATIDRLCRAGRIPFVRVGEVRRFDPVTVRQSLEKYANEPSATPSGSTPGRVRVPGVRLLSRGLR